MPRSASKWPVTLEVMEGPRSKAEKLVADLAAAGERSKAVEGRA
jgi:hypothetical protein